MSSAPAYVSSAAATGLCSQLKERALSAGSLLSIHQNKSIENIAPRLAAIGCKPGGKGRASRVYDLTVEGAHCYFAGGVLVSNCDSLRTFCEGMAKGLLHASKSTRRRPKVVSGHGDSFNPLPKNVGKRRIKVRGKL